MSIGTFPALDPPRRIAKGKVKSLPEYVVNCTLVNSRVRSHNVATMQDIQDDHIKGAIGEEILDQVKAIHELVAAQPTRIEFNELKSDVTELKSGMKVVRAAIKSQSKQLAHHEELLSK